MPEKFDVLRPQDGVRDAKTPVVAGLFRERTYLLSPTFLCFLFFVKQMSFFFFFKGATWLRAQSADFLLVQVMMFKFDQMFEPFELCL